MHPHARESGRQNTLGADPDARTRAPGPTLWAVASGKGGVGKSVFSSSLAIGLASTGPRALAVDLDLGGANLHSVFGCAHARYTLSDVVRGDVPLEEALVDTTIPGVRLLSGARAALDAANPHYQQKQKLLRSLRKIDVGHVVMDLGAGSAFNTLDAFLAADRRILVTTPEPTAVENTYHFLKAAFFRSLRKVAREPEVRAVLEDILEAARREGATPRELVEAAGRANASVGAKLRERVDAFEIDLIVNRSDLTSARRDPGIELAAATRAQLGANLRLAASIPSDSAVAAAVERGVPVVQLFPKTPFSVEVSRAVQRLIVDEPIPTTPTPGSQVRPRRTAVESAEDVPPEPPMPRFDGRAPGAHLRACRELLGLALNQLHERTRIRHHYLERIEREDYANLPPEFYLQAYVRQIAAALGLPDGDRIAEVFLARAREYGDALGTGDSRGPKGGRTARREEVPAASELIAALDFEPELDAFDAPAESQPEAPAESQPDAPAESQPDAPAEPASCEASTREIHPPKASGEASPVATDVAARPSLTGSTNATIAGLLRREEGVGFSIALERLREAHAQAQASELAPDLERPRRTPPTRRRKRRRLRS